MLLSSGEIKSGTPYPIIGIMAKQTVAYQFQLGIVLFGNIYTTPISANEFFLSARITPHKGTTVFSTTLCSSILMLSKEMQLHENKHPTRRCSVRRTRCAGRRTLTFDEKNENTTDIHRRANPNDDMPRRITGNRSGGQPNDKLTGRRLNLLRPTEGTKEELAYWRCSPSSTERYCICRQLRLDRDGYSRLRAIPRNNAYNQRDSRKQNT